MRIKDTKLKGCVILEPKIFEDERGHFFESFNEKFFYNNVAKVDFIQDNEALSSLGVLRGLHFQNGKYAQAKLVRVVKGEVLDVAVDIRRDSKTFGEHVSVILSEHNNKQLFVPRGFAHGYVVLSDKATFQYKVDNIYSPANESGIRWDDSDLGIDWGLPKDILIVSNKDKMLSKLNEIKNELDR